MAASEAGALSPISIGSGLLLRPDDQASFVSKMVSTTGVVETVKTILGRTLVLGQYVDSFWGGFQSQTMESVASLPTWGVTLIRVRSLGVLLSVGSKKLASGAAT